MNTTETMEATALEVTEAVEATKGIEDTTNAADAMDAKGTEGMEGMEGTEAPSLCAFLDLQESPVASWTSTIARERYQGARETLTRPFNRPNSLRPPLGFCL